MDLIRGPARSGYTTLRRVKKRLTHPQKTPGGILVSLLFECFMMAHHDGIPCECTCPLVYATAVNHEFALLELPDNEPEVYPLELLICDLEDDVFYPAPPDPDPEPMDCSEFVHSRPNSPMECDDPEVLEICSMELDEQGAGSSKPSTNPNQSGNTGTIVYNYYANQYQNSVDLSGSASSASGAPTKPTNALGSILSDATSAFATMAPLLMDNDTETMTNLADRVSTDTQGNTAVNTQSSVGRLCAYGAEHAGEAPASCADAPTQRVLAAERYYTISGLPEWTSTQDFPSFLYLPLPHILSGETGGVFGATLRRHYLCKTGWRIQLQCNASQFHCGCLGLFLVPEFPRLNDPFEASTAWETASVWGAAQGTTTGYANISLDHMNWYQMCLYPHQFLNLRTSTSVDLEVPFVNIAPTSSWTQHAPWSIVIVVLSPLKYSSGSTPSLDLTLSIQPVNPVFNGLRHETLVTQAPIPVTVREHQGCFYTTMPDTTVPVMGRTIASPHDYMVGEVKDLVSIAQIPTFLGNVKNTNRVPYISTSQTQQLLVSYQVTLACACMANTSLGSLARNFSQYRGSLSYVFVFTGSAMAKGKFLISYTPPGAGAPTTVEQAMQGTYAIWDIGLNSSWQFTVPFISPTHYRLTSYSNPTITSVDGWLTVWQLTGITVPAGAPPQCDILTLLGAGEDFSFKIPVQAYLPLVEQGTDNAEKGVVENETAASDFVAHPLSSPGNQTLVNFFYDRAVCVGNAAASNQARPTSPVLLSHLPSLNGVAQRWFASTDSNVRLGGIGDLASFFYMPFTYCKYDLEVTMLDCSNDANNTYSLHYVPPGAPDFIMANTRAFVAQLQPQAASRNPAIFQPQQGVKTMSMVVPYASPLSVLPAVWYNGYGTFDNSGVNGLAPDANLGKIFVASFQAGRSMQVFFRYKNFRAWCPRPSSFFPWPTTTRVVRQECLAVMELESPPVSRVYCFEFKCQVGILSAKLFQLCPRSRALYSQTFVTDINSFTAFKRWVRGSPYGGGSHFTNETYTSRVLFFERPYGYKVQYRFGCVTRYQKKVYKDLTMENVLGEFDFFSLQGFDNWLQGRLEEQGAGISTHAYEEINFQQQDKPPNPPKCDRPKLEKPPKALFSVLRKMLGQDEIGPFEDLWSLVKKLVKAFNSVVDTLHKPYFWIAQIRKITKFIAYTILIKHNPDATTLACVAALVGAEMLDNRSIMDFIVNCFRSWFTTPPPAMMEEQMPKMKDLNDYFTLGKNIEWVVKTVKNVFNWITAWFKQEGDSLQGRLNGLLLDFAHNAEVIQNYRAGKGVRQPTLRVSIAYMKSVYDLAMKLGKTNIANAANKFMQVNNHHHSRLEPVVVVLRGAPGQGKSVGAQILAQAISKLETGKQSVYSVPPDSNYLDGYENQHTVIMDDLGQNPDGKDFATFCQMVSTTNYLPNMAHLENKGIPFTSRVVIATTNHARFNPVTISDSGAVDRRITFDIEVCARSEYKNGRTLDLAAAMKPIQDQEPPLPCFTQQCPLINGEAVCFTDNRTRQNYSLADLVCLVCAELSAKKETLDVANALVMQSPELIITMEQMEEAMKNVFEVAHQVTTEERAELLQAIKDALNHAQIMDDWMKISATCLNVMLVAFTGYQLYSAWSSNSAEKPLKVVIDAATVPGEEEAAYNGRVKKKKVELVPMQLEAPAVSPDFANYVLKKVVTPMVLRFESGGTLTQSCLMIRERIIVSNKHALSLDWTHIQVKGFWHTRESVVVQAICRGGHSTDIAAVRLPSGDQFKDNVSKFISKNDPFPLPMTQIIGVKNSDTALLFQGTFVKAQTQIFSTSGNQYGNAFHYRANTFKGWCGSALFGKCGNSDKIIGFHSAGASGVAAGSILTREMLEQICANLEPTMEEQGALTLIGTGDVSHVPRKTKLRKSLAHPHFKPEYDVAVLSRYDTRTDQNVDEVCFQKHTGNKEKLSPVFGLYFTEYAQRVFTQLGTDNGCLTIQEAVDGVEGMDAMEKDTSPGLPHTLQGKRREDVFDFEKKQFKSTEAALSYRQMVDGDYSHVVYQSFLKDEIRPIEKVQAAKTRLVDVPPFEHCLLGRQYLGKFAAKFYKNPGTLLGSAIGCDPDTDWTKFAVALNQYKYVYDVDYSNFDSTHSTAIFELAISKFFNARNGFDPRVGDYLRSLATSVHAYEDARYKIVGGLPSGCAATSLLNTVFNNVIIRAGLALTYKNFEYDDIEVLAYGDDLLVASNFKIDFNLVKNNLSKEGYKITPASKGDTFPLESTLDECVFLKRKFVKTDLGLYKPVMSEKVLQAMLSFYKPGTLAEKLLSVALLAVHSGQEVYDRCFAPFREAGVVIPGYELVYERWLSLHQ